MAKRTVTKLFSELTTFVQNSASRSVQGIKGELLKLELDRFVYDFKEEKANENWVAVSDKEFGGKSDCFFEKSKHGQCVFRGNVSTELPSGNEDAKYSGFCAVKSKPLTGFLDKTVPHDLDMFDTIELRLRGDGRTYFFNIHPFNQSPDDLYQALICTRGGPYWEVIQIPYSKFALTNQGFLQDTQIRFGRIKSFGFSVSDKKNGPFHLELDYIRAIARLIQPNEFD